LDGEILDAHKLISGANAGPLARSSRREISGAYLVLLAGGAFLVHPGDAIVVQGIGPQVHETQNGADNGDNRKYKQQSTRELVSRFPH
jgi:hypothetical protein